MSDKETELVSHGGTGQAGAVSNDSTIDPHTMMVDPSFTIAFKNLLWKNYKQQIVRRPKSTCCRILLPMIFVVIMGLIRIEYDVEKYDDLIYDINKGEFSSAQEYDTYATSYDCSNGNCTAYTSLSYGDSWYEDELPIPAEWSNVDFPDYLGTVDDAKYSLLCFDVSLLPDDDDLQTPPYLIGIVPNPFNQSESGMTELAFNHYQTFFNTLNKTWGNVYDEYENVSDWSDCSSNYYKLPWKQGWLLKYFKDESELSSYVKDRDYGSEWNVSSTESKHRPIGFAIVVNSISDDGLQWEYKLRFNYSKCADTNERIDKFTRFYDTLIEYTTDLYKWDGFGPTQIWVEKAISYVIGQTTETASEYVTELEVEVGNQTQYLYEKFNIISFPFPMPKFERDSFWDDFAFLAFFEILVQFVYPINVMVSVLVNEKADKIAEGLKMMGANWGAYWATWILWFAVEMTLTALLIAIAGSIFAVYKYSDFSVMFVYYWTMTLSLSGMSMLIASLMDNPKMAALVGVTSWIVLLIFGSFGQLVGETGRTWICLLAPACINLSISNLSAYESALLGLQWENIGDKYDGFKFQTAIIMFVVDYVLYTLLALYFDKTWPSKYGSKEPFFFLCLPSFWKKEKIELTASKVEIKRQFTQMDTATYEDTDKYVDKQPSIAIRHLRKHFEPLFGSGTVVKAVDGISLNMYEGEVFCLLGHNGAGKTTTIGMLTGLLTVTEGDAYIHGSSVKEAMIECRKYMGVCPQHDVLFPLLSVKEHLIMYCKLKGCKPEFVDAEVERTIDDVSLRDKIDYFPTQLSAGERRKLSLAIAFVGQSKVVFLDEPTSGMDPQARRITWELIAREKARRTVILTTHYMDEADFLGDRIAIMAGGKVRCCGSSLFLKHLYGVGYTMTISLRIGVKPIKAKKDLDKVILQHVPNAKSLAIAGGEVNYRLPFNESSKFPSMFEGLDAAEKNDNVGISAYGVSVTTLEEVFLKIGHDDEPMTEGAAEAKAAESQYIPDASNPQLQNQDSVNENENENENENDKGKSGGYNTIDVGRDNALTGNAYENPFPQPDFKLHIGQDDTIFAKIKKETFIFLIHCYAILYRRFWWSLRDVRGLICQLLIPGIIAAMGLGVLKIFFEGSYPSLEMMVDSQDWTNDKAVINYGVPINNLSFIENSVAVSDMNPNYITTWNEYMEEDWGFLDDSEYIMENVSDGTEYVTDLLNTASDNNYIHYYSYGFLNESDTFLIGMNVSAYHSWPVSMNGLRNWILKTEIDNSINIKLTSHPLPTTTTEDAFDDFVLGLIASLYLLIAFAFVPVGAIYQIVLDKVTHTKHQQFVSGMSLYAYWVGNFIADICNSLPAGALVVMMVYIFDTKSFKGDAIGPFICSILAFIFAITPFTYLLSFLFRDPSGAQRWVAMLYIILGIVLFITTWILESIGVDWVGDLRDVFIIFPTFLLCDAIYAIALIDIFDYGRSYYDWKVAGKSLSYLCYEGIIYFALLLIIEWISHQPRILQALGLITNIEKETETLDEDVVKEQKRIKDAVTLGVGGSGELNKEKVDDAVVLSGLRKVYKGQGHAPNVAVKDMWFGVPQEQVFGFLGVSGAGKTTTLSVLTGEAHASEGTGFINGYPITEQNTIRRFIGYCPQFDALYELLTGEEHLRFYGTLKGLSGKELDDQINMLLKVLSLTKYRHRRAGTYSGGNKRKLSVAISFIGNPPVVLLDEPSAGMDPVSRRHMWEFISKTMNGRSVILTTHSMEECEALCHRIAIMVGGQLLCIGSPQHIKSRFGHGYQLDVMLTNAETSTRVEVEQALLNLFEVKCLEVNRHKATYELNEKAEWVKQNGKLTLAQLFRELEKLKTNKPIQSYAVNQTSLEQIFLKMAKGEAKPNEDFKDDSKDDSIDDNLNGNITTNNNNNNNNYDNDNDNDNDNNNKDNIVKDDTNTNTGATNTGANGAATTNNVSDGGDDYNDNDNNNDSNENGNNDNNNDGENNDNDNDNNDDDDNDNDNNNEYHD